MESVYSLTSKDWAQYLKSSGESEHVLSYWLDGLYTNPDALLKHISPKTLSSAKEKFDLTLPKITKTQESSDGTVKFQVAMRDGLEVETVLIPFHKKFTVCLSTQVGCGMNCSFCYTGTQGLKRNLTPGEIVGQYLVAKNWLKEKQPTLPPPRIVFMGQGEPLHNAASVKKALEVLTDLKTVGVGHRQITLSTVGYLPGFETLKSFPSINIALSLHSPFEEERNKLIPINAKFSLENVLKELDTIPLLKRQFITFEYLLVKDFNMSEAHADKLRELLSTKKAILNLIPFNPFPGSEWKRPDAAEVEAFKEMLVERKLRVMVRNTKGDDILAACGQLKIQELARNHVR